MEIMEEKSEIVTNWLDTNNFFNIQKSSDNQFIKADGYKSRMVIAIQGDDEIDESQMLEFAARNHRQAWVAEIKVKTSKIEWKTL